MRLDVPILILSGISPSYDLEISDGPRRPSIRHEKSFEGPGVLGRNILSLHHDNVKKASGCVSIPDEKTLISSIGHEI